ncbi:MAG: succinate dehydrogenase assembly factor 2 [Devosia sp.]|nr:succinate dehydrogenase assembly factor 2 [Devosia sp.]
MAPSEDAGEHLPMRLRRLRFRAWHRGTKEMDLLLGPFADARLEGMAEAELDRFEALLEEADTDLLKWLTGQEPAPADADRALLSELLAFRIQTHG